MCLIACCAVHCGAEQCQKSAKIQQRNREVSREKRSMKNRKTGKEKQQQWTRCTKRDEKQERKGNEKEMHEKKRVLGVGLKRGLPGLAGAGLGFGCISTTRMHQHNSDEPAQPIHNSRFDAQAPAPAQAQAPTQPQAQPGGHKRVPGGVRLRHK